MALLADGVSSLLIDGKLTSGNQGTFATINPATEEVLGAAADADPKTWATRSRRRVGPSTTPTGRVTPSCGCGVSASCRRRCSSTSKNCAT